MLWLTLTQGTTVHLGHAGNTGKVNRYNHNSGNKAIRAIQKQTKKIQRQKLLVQQKLLLPEIVEADDIWGDIPETGHGNCRVVMQNVNGIRGDNDFASAHTMAEHAIQIEGNIIGLIETNVDWRSTGSQGKIRNIFRKYWPRVVFASSSSDRRQKGVYQPGGTLSFVTSPWASRTSAGTDSRGLGRWSTLTVIGRSNTKITFITAYRVDGTRTTKGPFTAYSQQLYLLEEKDSANTDPISNFYTDLKELIQKMQREQHEIVIMMDANACMADLKNKFAQWVLELKLVDPMTARHGTERQPATFQGGKHRIDYFLTTPVIYKYVKKAGILPFASYYESDHRALFLDIDMAAYLQGEPSLELATETRHINGKNHKSIAIYKSELEKFFQTSGYMQRLYDFETLHAQQKVLSEVMATELDNLDNELTSAKLYAESKCKRKVQVPWSPKIKELNDEIRYWKLWRKQDRTNINYGRKRASIKVTFNVPTTVPTIAVIRKSIRDTENKIKLVKSNAAQHRVEFLTDQAMVHETANKKEAKAAVTRIKNAEHLSGIFQRLQSIMGKTRGPGIAFILLPLLHGKFETVVHSEKVETHICESNYKHFGQANDTTFATNLLKKIFGQYGTNEESMRLLNGIIPEELTHESEALLSILNKIQKVDGVDEISGRVTIDEVKNGYKKWRESTTTSPSGCHLGHDKAALNAILSPEEDAIQFTDTYFDAKTRLLNMALQHCHVYPRWKKIINALIEKIPGLPLLGKLRVIHIIESDLNLLMGIAWGRKLMWQGEDLQVFGEEQSGGRKGKRCQDVLLFKHLVYSILRLSKSNGSTFDNDAKSCYDRIVMLGASLMAQRIGMDKEVLELFLKMLEEVKYHAKTVYGVSNQFYQSSKTYGIHGPGQGGRASPSVWTVISCLILSCMKEKAIGANLISPDKNFAVSQVASGFVDDITHWNIHMSRSLIEGDTTETINAETTTAAQWWEELLCTTGGKLELSKCFYYPIIWEFDHDGNATIQEPSQTNASIILKDSITKENIPIEAKSCNDAHKTLGVMACPQGNNSAEYQRMKTKCSNFAQRMGSAILTREEATIFYRTICIPSITYSFAVGTFNEKQAQSLQGSLTQATLNGMGYNRKTPSAVVYGPTSLGGIGMRHLFAEQGTMQAQIIIQHIRAFTQLGSTILIQLNWAQLVSGRSTPILEIPSEVIPHLENEQWLITLRRFLALSHITMHISDIATPIGKRVNDQILMDVAAGSTWSPNETKQINKCRIFLKAESISDIATRSGTHINDDSWNVHREELRRDKLWPTQSQPGKQSIAIWKRFLKSLCMEMSHQLRISLGEWTSPPHTGYSNAVYDSILDAIIVRAPDKSIQQYHQIRKHRTKWKGYRSCTTDPACRQYQRDQGSPVDILEISRDTITIAPPSYHSYTNETSRNEATTWEEYISTLPEWEITLLQGCHQLDDRYPLWQYLMEPQAIIYAVSDGGVNGTIGTFGWVIATTSKVICRGKGRVFGRNISSHRAEVCGMLSWLLYLYHYHTFLHCDIKCTLHSFCDNKAAISNVNNFKSATRNSMIPDFDIIQEASLIFGLLKRPGNGIKQILHVKGHQDRTTPLDKLSWPAVLNIKADQLATDAMINAPSQSSHINVTNNPIRLQIGQEIITAHEMEILRWRWREFILQEYLETRFNIKPHELHHINWAAIQLARKKLPSSLIPFSVKLMIKWLPVGTRMEKYGNNMTMCYFCNDEEDFDHLFCCTKKRTQQRQLHKDFDTELQRLGTAPAIRKALLQGVNSWITQDDTGNHDESTTAATHQQYQIGWHRTMCGIFGCEWSNLQEKYDTTKMGDTWQASICSFMISKAHEFWVERNATMYDHDQKDKITREESEIISQVQHLYNRQIEMSQYDAHEIFGVPIEKRLTFTAATNKAWIIPTRREVIKRIKIWTDQLRRRQPDIRQFFQKKRKHNSDTLNDTIDEIEEDIGDDTEDQDIGG
jgi:hypothetical protein